MSNSVDRILVREKHPRLIRWSHWLNVPLLLIMMWSGILIYWANDAYIKIPASIAKTLGIDHKLAEGMGWHFSIMWPFALNGLIYVIYLIVSGEWREVLPERGSFREALRVIAHDLKLRKDLPVQKGKLNGAQRFAYTGALFLGAGVVITGIAIHKPVQISWLTEALGGYPAARFEHFLCMCGLILFVFVHVAQVIRSGWNNLRAMISGYEIVSEKEEQAK